MISAVNLTEVLIRNYPSFKLVVMLGAPCLNRIDQFHQLPVAIRPDVVLLFPAANPAPAFNQDLIAPKVLAQANRVVSESVLFRLN